MYAYTTQAQIIKAFKADFPNLDYKSREYSGTEYTTDTRCAFLDFLRYLEDSKQISETLAAKATLRPPQRTKPKPRPVHIEGRRWFDKRAGNTYNSATIHLNNGESIYLPMAYGYDDFYIQRAEEYIKQHWKYKNPDKLTGTRFLREVAKITYSVADVTRQRDL